MAGTTKSADADGSLGEPVTLGGAVIETGDVVVGDEDGIVVLAAWESDEVLSRARRRQERERETAGRIRRGESLARLLEPMLP